MRLVTLGAVFACAAVVVACADQPSAPKNAALAEGAQLRIHGTTTFTVHTPRGAEEHALPSWGASAVIKSGIAREESAQPALGVLGVTNRAFVPASAATKSRTASFIDPAGVRHAVVFISGGDGAPPRKIAHFVNGQLTQVTTYDWKAANGGWTVASAAHTEYREGKATSEIRSVASGAVEMAARPLGNSMRALLALAISLAAPADANAQLLSGKCRMEWLTYVAATATLSVALQALALNPGNPALIAAAAAAAAAATIAEMRLWICQENNPGTGNGGGGTGGNGGGPPPVVPRPCDLDPMGPGCDGPIDLAL